MPVRGRYISFEDYFKCSWPNFSLQQSSRVTQLFTLPANTKKTHATNRLRCLIRVDLLSSMEKVLPARNQAMRLEDLPDKLLHQIFDELPYDTLKQISESAHARFAKLAGNVMVEQLAQGLSAYVGRGTVSRRQIHAKQGLNDAIRKCTWQGEPQPDQEDNSPTNLDKPDEQAHKADHPKRATLQSIPVEILLQILLDLPFTSLRNTIDADLGSPSYVAETILFQQRSTIHENNVGKTRREFSKEHTSICPECLGSLQHASQNQKCQTLHGQCTAEDRSTARPWPPICEKAEHYLSSKFVLVTAQGEDESGKAQRGLSVLRKLGSFWWVLRIDKVSSDKESI